MDLLEDMSKREAHLPVQDVLSIFFQVMPMLQTLCNPFSCKIGDRSAVTHSMAQDALSATLSLQRSMQTAYIS